MRDLDAAQKWGCPSPQTFDELGRDHQVDVIAWYEARWRIDAVNAYEASKKPKARKRR